MILPNSNLPHLTWKKKWCEVPPIYFLRHFQHLSGPPGGASWHQDSSREAFDPEADAKDLRYGEGEGIFCWKEKPMMQN